MAADHGGPMPVLVMLTRDLVIARRLRQVAAEHALTVWDAGDSPVSPGGEPGGQPAVAGDQPDVARDQPDVAGDQPAVAVIDLLRPDAIDRVRAWRAAWPDAIIAAHIGTPDRELWIRAQRAGCDLVVNRGALVPRLRARLARRSGQRAHRFPLFDLADAAGRLGLVFSADDTPVGPLAVYRVAGEFYAIADRCPHAGAVLCGGEVESGVLTCPGHGSRFDIRTGERVRGPADTGVTRYPLVQDAGQVFLLIRPG